jgi:hypothetical protein
MPQDSTLYHLTEKMDQSGTSHWSYTISRNDRHRMPILSSVTPGRERYCRVLAEHLDKVWTDHPTMYFALPIGRTAAYDKVIHTSATTFTETLLRGLEKLKKNFCVRHVFVLLEDHIPLWPCDAKKIQQILKVVEEEDLKCVFFTKYDWPWNHTNYGLDDNGRVIGWRAIDIATFGSHRMARMPKDFFRYNQCQPAIWNIDYYIDVVAEACRRGIRDPWEFESYVMPNQPQHYVSEYKWPSWTNGYLYRGKVDWRAVRLMKMPEARGLRTQLLKEYFPNMPTNPELAYVIGECVYHLRRLKSALGRLTRRLSRSIGG